MEFQLDTAAISQIETYQALQLVDGVTTNPALLAQEGADPLRQIKKIAEIVTGPISVEVTQTTPEGMVAQAQRLRALADNVVIKVPASLAGLAAATQLRALDVPMNITLIFHPSQAIPFIKLGVKYVSLFVGRVEDFGLSNRDAIQQLRLAIDAIQSETKLLAASIRNPEYLIESVIGGADALTVPPSCWEKTFGNPMFQLGEREFLDAWRGLPQSIRDEYERA